MELPLEVSEPIVGLNNYIYLIYGAPKAGKTTFCSHFENALFIATEPGHKFQKIFKLDPKSWTDITKIAKRLLTEKHSFKTVVFDTADNAYKMCEQHICNKLKIEHVSDLGFGKGYAAVKDEFMKVINALAQYGFGIVFISHAETKDLEEGAVKRSYTDTTLSGSAKKIIAGLSDYILFCYVNSEGQRLMRTKGTPHLNAGDRSGVLPDIMPLDFEGFKTKIVEYQQTLE